MPILGVTAILGAVVPTVVACNKDESGDSVEVEWSKPDGYTLVSSTTTLPKSHVGKEYKVKLQWKLKNDDSASLVDSYAYTISIHTKEIGFIQFYSNAGLNEVTITIPAQLVQPNMIISIEVAEAGYDAQFAVDKGDAEIVALDERGEEKTVSGVKIKNGMTDLTDEDNIIEFNISLSALDEQMQDTYGVDNGLAGCTDLVFYMTNGDGNRTFPLSVGNVWLGTDVLLDRTWSYETFSLHIYFQGGLKQETIDAKANVTGYFNYTIDFSGDLNNGNMYAFDRRALGYEPVNP